MKKTSPASSPVLRSATPVKLTGVTRYSLGEGGREEGGGLLLLDLVLQ